MREGDRPRVAVVTGASAGIGRATADLFAAQGTAVALLARNAARLGAALRTDRARRHSVQWWLSVHRRELLAGGALALAGLLLASARH